MSREKRACAKCGVPERRESLFTVEVIGRTKDDAVTSKRTTYLCLACLEQQVAPPTGQEPLGTG